MQSSFPSPIQKAKETKQTQYTCVNNNIKTSKQSKSNAKTNAKNAKINKKDAGNQNQNADVAFIYASM